MSLFPNVIPISWDWFNVERLWGHERGYLHNIHFNTNYLNIETHFIAETGCIVDSRPFQLSKAHRKGISFSITTVCSLYQTVFVHASEYMYTIEIKLILQIKYELVYKIYILFFYCRWNRFITLYFNCLSVYKNMYWSLSVVTTDNVQSLWWYHQS